MQNTQDTKSPGGQISLVNFDQSRNSDLNEFRMSNKILVYGAYGYTGRLIVALAVERGLSKNIIVGGRDKDKTLALAKKYNIEATSVFTVDQDGFEKNLDDVSVLLNCAGPFELTCRQFASACLKKKVHYTDITGEIDVFETLATYDKQAKDAGIVIMPGTGFDVVPSDCMALKLKEALPDATSLELAFSTKGTGLSRGTLKTLVTNMFRGAGFKKRVDGVIVGGAPTFQEIEVTKSKLELCSISWGDVSTAFYSTGIPNITVYTGAPKFLVLLQYYVLSYIFFFLPFLGAIAVAYLDRFYDGPALESTKDARAYCWGCVKNAKGDKVVKKFSVGEPYRLTADTSLKIAEMLLKGEIKKTGFMTPSSACGSNFIDQFQGFQNEE